MRPDEMALMIPMLAIGGSFLIALVAVLSNAVSKVFMHWRDVSLKIRLVESGMNAEEIERIVHASSSRRTNARSRRMACASHDSKPPVHADIKAKQIAGNPV